MLDHQITISTGNPGAHRFAPSWGCGFIVYGTVCCMEAQRTINQCWDWCPMQLMICPATVEPSSSTSPTVAPSAGVGNGCHKQIDCGFPMQNTLLACQRSLGKLTLGTTILHESPVGLLLVLYPHWIHFTHKVCCTPMLMQLISIVFFPPAAS